MRRPLALLSTATALVVAFAAQPAADARAAEQLVVHPNGVALHLGKVELRDEAIVVAATIDNRGDREIRLNRARALVLDDGAHGVHYLNPPADNPELRIPPHTAASGELVFIGPLTAGGPTLVLSTNRGIGTADNPYDDAPAMQAPLPVEPRAAAPTASATHPDGASLALRQLTAGPALCAVSLVAANGNDRAVLLNKDADLVLLDRAGSAAALQPPSENRELVVPPGDRLDAKLVFDCHGLDKSGPLILVTNRGTAGTSDNPYDTLPVFTLEAPPGPANPAPAARSTAAVTPIARSHLRGAAIAASPAPQAAAAASTATPPPPTPPTPPAGEGRSAVASAAAKGAAATTLPQLEAALHAAKTDRGLRLVLPADDLFGAAGDAIDVAEPLLNQLTELIGATRPHEIVIAGHTDSIGNDDDNEALSRQRAHAVAAWLAAHLTKQPQPRPRLVEQAYGRTRPLAPNHNADGSDNPEGRARNRRIEITLRR